MLVGSLIPLDLLTLQEAAVENVGPVDDGTESLGDVPSLSEEVAGMGRHEYRSTSNICV